MEEALGKVFSQEDYDDCDDLGKTYAIAAAKCYGWECVKSKECKSKSDLFFSKNGKIKMVEVEVRDDNSDNFDKIGQIWDTLDIPIRKGNVAKEKNQVAHIFLTFRKDGKYFWQAKMSYVLTFDPVKKKCKRKNKEWFELTHRAKIDNIHVEKFEVEWDNTHSVVLGVKKIEVTPKKSS